MKTGILTDGTPRAIAGPTRCVFRTTTILLITLCAAFVDNAQVKPVPSNYLGRWEGTVESLNGSEGACHLEISRLGESFLIKNERQEIDNCEVYEGVWTLTNEDNLKGGPMGTLVIAFDAKNQRAVVSGMGKLRYLTRGLSDKQIADRIAQQKRAMSDIRSIARAADFVSGLTSNATSIPARLSQVRSVAELSKAAGNKSKLPVTDPWGSPYLFAATDDGYVITSYGADRKPDAQRMRGGTRTFATDIIYIHKSRPDGTTEFDGFATYPEGPQH